MKKILLFSTMLLSVTCIFAQKLDELFVNPPESARPYTWWHWIEGNITKEGITADLEAMQRAGLAGCYMFNCGGRMPRGDVRFMEPDWQAMFQHAVKESKRLNLKFGVHNCDGFSQSGGPWITPEKSMKQLTWEAVTIDGGTPVEVVLPQPSIKENFYRDIAVIAFPLPQGEDLIPERMAGSSGVTSPKHLTDNNAKTIVAFPPTETANSVDYIFNAPQTIRSLRIRGFSPHLWEDNLVMELLASSDRETFKSIMEFTPNFDLQNNDSITIAFEDTTAQFFRIHVKNRQRARFSEIQLSSAAKVHFAETKAATVRARGHGAEAQQYRDFGGPSLQRAVPDNHTVKLNTIRNLTRNMDAQGRFKWNAPQGKWRVLRIGYTSNGHYVGPATEEGSGLECDKLDPDTVRFHLDQYVGKLVKLAGSESGKTFTTVEIDSWECGIQNWSAGLEKRFDSRTKCRLLNFMPTLLEGWIINNPDTSERFLWEWRRFLADQISENYFSTAASYLADKGLIYVGESNGRQQYLYDISYSRNSAITMGEFWLGGGLGQGVRVDNKLASSIANIAGKKIVASEAFTSSPQSAKWQNHPFSLKPLGDEAFCAGINQFVFHTFAHQPYDVIGPGFTFFFWGLNYNRHNSWWEDVNAWNMYLTRCNFMLRRGTQACDVLWFVGEDIPNVIEWRDSLVPKLPYGYDFDGCDAQTLFEAKVNAVGNIVLPSGNSYKVLLLPDKASMRLSVATRVRELISHGATVLAPQLPLRSPALSEIENGDALVQKIVSEFQDAPNLHQAISFEQVFAKLKLAPDFSYTAKQPEADILYVRRTTAQEEIYFVANQRDRIENIEAWFRVADKVPEIWDPVSGRQVTAAAWRRESDRTVVDLRLERFGSLFIVFRDNAQTKSGVQIVECKEELPIVNPPVFVERQKLFAALSREDALTLKMPDGKTKSLSGSIVPAALPLSQPWTISFPAKHGAPESVVCPQLKSLSEHSDTGVRYFSGTAEYSTTFTVDSALFGKNRKLYLNLGDVQVIARVELNNEKIATLWKPPFVVEVTDKLRKGNNTLKVHVATLWPNRMIGDAALPENDIKWDPKITAGNQLPAEWPDWLKQGKPRPSGRVTFCTRRNAYQRNHPLLPSGLIGPVTIVPTQRFEIN